MLVEEDAGGCGGLWVVEDVEDVGGGWDVEDVEDVGGGCGGCVGGGVEDGDVGWRMWRMWAGDVGGCG